MADIAISGAIKEKISWARKIYGKTGKRLHRDEETVRLLSSLQQAVIRAREAMEEAGVLERCRICDELEGGSCCGKGIENRYDGYLLIINLALSADLPAESWDKKSCFFLSPGGCCLEARHVICINYLCKDALDHVDPAALKKLQVLEGEEIDLLFQLHERIKKVIRASSDTSFLKQGNG
jgi:tRNA U54 and U55 pseudouridine synthase Pus10